MKRFLVLGLVVCAGLAQASFELLLVADNGMGTFETRKIHRFDPTTGVYLGGFGGFGSPIVSTHLDQATNSLYVIEATTITRWNYNTGMLLSSHSAVNGAYLTTVRPDEGRIAVFDGLADFLTKPFPDMGPPVSSAGFMPSAAYRAGLWFQQNTIMAWDEANKRFRLISMDPLGQSGAAGLESLSFSTGDFGQMSLVGGSNRVVMAAGGELRFATLDTVTPGLIASPYGLSKAAASAHDGYYVGGTSSGVGRVTYYDRNFNVRGIFTNGTLMDPISMQTVLAPEPGTFVAIGVGLAALLRRRKK